MRGGEFIEIILLPLSPDTCHNGYKPRGIAASVIAGLPVPSLLTADTDNLRDIQRRFIVCGDNIIVGLTCRQIHQEGSGKHSLADQRLALPCHQ